MSVQVRDTAGVSVADFQAGMRRLAAACAIITARSDDGLRAGLTATALCPVTADPPRLMVCINRSVGAHRAIVHSRALGVNILGEAHHELAQRFAGLHGVTRDERFAAGDWRTAATGAPILADALVSFDCRLVEAIAASTHDIFLCEVVDLQVTDDARPMLYFDRGFRGLAEPQTGPAQ